MQLPQTMTRVLAKAKKQGVTLACAESCSGGLLASFLTELPGSSDIFLGGVSAYANAAKTKLLGVSPGKLEKFGAVSREVAEEMAANVRKLLGASIGISITGIAGPTGGSKEKPIGTVWLGVATSAKTYAKLHQFSGSREKIRMDSALAALEEIEHVL